VGAHRGKAGLDVQPGKNIRPDVFSVLIKGVSKDETTGNDHENEFSAKCSFVRLGEWWLLNEIKTSLSR
jgi:hypothetical protein